MVAAALGSAFGAALVVAAALGPGGRTALGAALAPTFRSRLASALAPGFRAGLGPCGGRLCRRCGVADVLAHRDRGEPAVVLRAELAVNDLRRRGEESLGFKR